MRFTARWRAWAAHHRVHVGIFFAIFYVALSRPSPERFLFGAALVIAGEAIRVWACGHLVRNKVLTRHGPYSRLRHPLYLGSLLIGIGLALLAQHVFIWLAAFGLLYLGFYLPAMYIEELRLQSLFGAEYQEYMEEVPRLIPRLGRTHGWPDQTTPETGFSWEISRQNRELRTVAVMLALLIIQALKGL